MRSFFGSPFLWALSSLPFSCVVAQRTPTTPPTPPPPITTIITLLPRDGDWRGGMKRAGIIDMSVKLSDLASATQFACEWGNIQNLTQPLTLGGSHLTNTINVRGANNDIPDGTYTVRDFLLINGTRAFPRISHSGFQYVAITQSFFVLSSELLATVGDLVCSELDTFTKSRSIYHGRNAFSVDQPTKKYSFDRDIRGLVALFNSAHADAEPIDTFDSSVDRHTSDLAKRNKGVFGIPIIRDAWSIGDMGSQFYDEIFSNDDSHYYETTSFYLILHYALPALIIALCTQFGVGATAHYYALGVYFLYWFSTTMFSDSGSSGVLWVLVTARTGSYEFLSSLITSDRKLHVLIPANYILTMFAVMLVSVASDNPVVIVVGSAFGTLLPIVMVIGPASIQFANVAIKSNSKHMRTVIISVAVLEGVLNACVLSSGAIDSQLQFIGTSSTMTAIHVVVSFAEHFTGLAALSSLRKRTRNYAAELYACRGRASCDTASASVKNLISRRKSAIDSTCLICFLVLFAFILYAIGRACAKAKKKLSKKDDEPGPVYLVAGSHVWLYSWFARSESDLLIPFLTLLRVGVAFSGLHVLLISMTIAFFMTMLPAEESKDATESAIKERNQELNKGTSDTRPPELYFRNEKEAPDVRFALPKTQESYDENPVLVISQHGTEAQVVAYDRALQLSKLTTLRDNVVKIFWTTSSGKRTGGTAIVCAKRGLLTVSHVVDACIGQRLQGKELPTRLTIEYNDGTSVETDVTSITKWPKEDGIDGIALVFVSDTLKGTFNVPEMFTGANQDHLFYLNSGNKNPTWVQEKKFDRESNTLFVKCNSKPGDSGSPCVSMDAQVRMLHGGSCHGGGWNYGMQLKESGAKALNLLSFTDYEFKEENPKYPVPIDGLRFVTPNGDEIIIDFADMYDGVKGVPGASNLPQINFFAPRKKN